MQCNTQLIRMTDDVVPVHDVNDDENVAYCVWESEVYDMCGDAMKVLKRWKGFKGCYDSRTELQTLLMMSVSNNQNGQMSGMVDLRVKMPLFLFIDRYIHTPSELPLSMVTSYWSYGRE